MPEITINSENNRKKQQKLKKKIRRRTEDTHKKNNEFYPRVIPFFRLLCRYYTATIDSHIMNQHERGYQMNLIQE